VRPEASPQQPANAASVSQLSVNNRCMEAHLGAELLRRTSAASASHKSAPRSTSRSPALSDLEAASHTSGDDRFPRRTRPCDVAPVLGGLYLIPKLQAFFAHIPISIRIANAPDLEDLHRARLDIAIHNGPLSEFLSHCAKDCVCPRHVVAHHLISTERALPTDMAPSRPT